MQNDSKKRTGRAHRHRWVRSIGFIKSTVGIHTNPQTRNTRTHRSWRVSVSYRIFFTSSLGRCKGRSVILNFNESTQRTIANDVTTVLPSPKHEKQLFYNYTVGIKLYVAQPWPRQGEVILRHLSPSAVPPVQSTLALVKRWYNSGINSPGSITRCHRHVINESRSIIVDRTDRTVRKAERAGSGIRMQYVSPPVSMDALEGIFIAQALNQERTWSNLIFSIRYMLRTQTWFFFELFVGINIMMTQKSRTRNGSFMLVATGSCLWSRDPYSNS